MDEATGACLVARLTAATDFGGGDALCGGECAAWGGERGEKGRGEAAGAAPAD